MGSYFVYASVWEACAANVGKDNVLTVYQQPPWLKSAALLGRLGMSAEGLADDFVFACIQKALLVSIAVWAYTKVVWPLMRVDKTKAT
ncbi:MAG: hypothetical protein SGPRY_004634 [Prymnesium sp.]